MKICFLSRWYPYPMDNGAKIRIFHLLEGLAGRHEVTLLSFTENQDRLVGDHPKPLAACCRQIATVRWTPFDPQQKAGPGDFLRPVPRSVRGTFSPEMAGLIEQELASGGYDLVIASQWQMAGYAPYFRGTPALFEELELGVLHDAFTQADSLAQRVRHGLTWYKHRRYLDRLAPAFRGATVVSEREQAIARRWLPAFEPIEIIPNGITVPAGPPAGEKDGQTLIFTGPFRYRVNYEAMVWFLERVYDHIRKAVPNVRLLITGDHDNLPLPEKPGVVLTGYVDDIQTLIAGAAVSIAPLLAGGGTRFKILEAMALGTPVVSTTKGAEGLAAADGVHLLLADDPESFAWAVLRLLGDETMRGRLAQNARELICRTYAWPAILPHFLAEVDRAAGWRTPEALHG